MSFPFRLPRLLTRIAVLSVTCATAASASAAVQVLGLGDRTGTAGKVGDNFCVVSNAPSAGISLSFTNTSGLAGDGQSWRALNAGGASVAYLQTVANADGSGEVTVSRSGGGNNVFVLTAARAAATAGACGAGNVLKSIAPTTGALPTGIGTYSDTVTVTATPL